MRITNTAPASKGLQDEAKPRIGNEELQRLGGATGSIWAAHERLGHPVAQAAGSCPHSLLLSRFRMAREGNAPELLPQESGNEPAMVFPFAASTRSWGSAPGAPHA